MFVNRGQNAKEFFWERQVSVYEKKTEEIKVK